MNRYFPEDSNGRFFFRPKRWVAFNLFLCESQITSIGFTIFIVEPLVGLKFGLASLIFVDKNFQ